MQATWPLTGRSEEMRLIEAALSDPESSGILICGSAGVGKSRVAREALDSAAARGFEVRWITATSSAKSLPLGALASWVNSGSADSLELVKGAIRALSSAPRGAPVVVGVDDVALLDDLSTFVVHQLIQRDTAKIILTVRTGGPIPVATQELWKAQRFYRLDLQPLARDETQALVSAALGGAVDPTVSERVWQLTRGNALYLRNIVDEEVAQERLARRGGYWRWVGDPVVPPGLIEMIEARFGALPEAISDVLDLLAVGEPLDLAVLRSIADPAAVEQAEVHGLIVLDRIDSRVEARVAHPLYGEVRRARAAATRLRRLRGVIASQLARSDDRDDIQTVVRRAALSLDSDLVPDRDLLLRAAQGAVRLADMALVDRLAQAAIDAGAGAQASILRAFALGWMSRADESEALIAQIPTAGLSDDDRTMIAVHRFINVMWGLGDPDSAKQLADDAARNSPTGRAWIDTLLTMYWSSMGKPDEAKHAASQLDLGQVPDDIGALAAWPLALAAGDSGRTSDAVATAETGYVMASRTFSAPQVRFNIADRHVGALLQAGLIEEAGSVADRLRQYAGDLPGGARAMSNAVAGRVALSAGRLTEAVNLLQPAVEQASASGDTNGFLYRYQVSLTLALGQLGRRENAVAALDSLQNYRHPGWRFIEYEHEIARAWVSACQGVVSEAIALTLAAAERARANGQFAPEVVCLQAATQFGDRTCTTRLRELEELVDGPRVRIAVQFSEALCDGDAPRLAAASETFEQMGDVVAATDAASYAALAFRRGELRGSALACSTRAQTLAAQCGGAHTPALGQAAEPLPLTDREREILLLFAAGLSTREVADRLTLSLRTIEGHIYRAMAKTGMDSRDELVTLVRPPNTGHAVTGWGSL